MGGIVFAAVCLSRFIANNFFLVPSWEVLQLLWSNVW